MVHPELTEYCTQLTGITQVLCNKLVICVIMCNKLVKELSSIHFSKVI